MKKKKIKEITIDQMMKDMITPCEHKWVTYHRKIDYTDDSDIRSMNIRIEEGSWCPLCNYFVPKDPSGEPFKLRIEGFTINDIELSFNDGLARMTEDDFRDIGYIKIRHDLIQNPLNTICPHCEEPLSEGEHIISLPSWYPPEKHNLTPMKIAHLHCVLKKIKEAEKEPI